VARAYGGNGDAHILTTGLGEARHGAGAENGLPGTNFLQVCCAALNWFVLGSTPAFLPMTSAPPGFGSGNLGTPCERMHSANLSIACWVFACCWAFGLPSGCSLRHALAADLNCCRSGRGAWAPRLSPRSPRA
jgi:hypothetical protein